MKIIIKIVLLIGISANLNCKKNTANRNPPSSDSIPVTDTTPSLTNTFFAKGADVSWLTQMEAQGYNFIIEMELRKTFFRY